MNEAIVHGIRKIFVEIVVDDIEYSDKVKKAIVEKFVNVCKLLRLLTVH